MKLVCQLDVDGYYIGQTLADESPLEPGVFLIPAGAVEALVPTIPDGKRARWDGGWVLENIPEPEPEPEQIPPTAEQKIQNLLEGIQSRLDEFAYTRKYDSILSACTYATSTIPKFQQEGQYCVQARDATWAAAHNILNDIETGTRPIPETITEIEDELPALSWPV